MSQYSLRLNTRPSSLSRNLSLSLELVKAAQQVQQLQHLQPAQHLQSLNPKANLQHIAGSTPLPISNLPRLTTVSSILS